MPRPVFIFKMVDWRHILPYNVTCRQQMEEALKAADNSLNGSGRLFIVVFSWILITFISDLPDIVSKLLLGQVPAWFPWAKIAAMALSVALTLAWKKARTLLPFASVMLVLFAALAGSEWVKTQSWWTTLLPDNLNNFALSFLRPYLRDIGVVLAVMATLWIIHRKRSPFFLAKGNLEAPVGPIHWLGIKPGESWSRFAWIFGVIAALAVALPTMLALKPSPSLLLKALPLLPACLLYAAINAFNEELYFRASMLSTLVGVVGKEQALLISSVFFGLAHWLYGSPPGLVGFAMTGFLAWILGRSMLETRGLLAPWLIHFLPDVVIFYSYALSYVQQAGK